MRSLTQASLALTFARYCGKPFLHLIKISHPSLSSPYYFCDDNQDFVSTVDGGVEQTFAWMPMQIAVPFEDPTRLPTASMSIANTDPDMTMSTIVNSTLNQGYLRKCTIWIVNSNDPNVAVAGPYAMFMRSPLLVMQTCTCTLEYDEAGDEQVPGHTMNPGTAPGIYSAPWFGLNEE